MATPSNKIVRPISAKELNNLWHVGAVESRFNWDGHWYKRLTRFPAAYFDPYGYLRFESEREYLACPGLRMGKQVGIRHPGISSLPGYVRMQGADTPDEVPRSPTAPTTVGLASHKASGRTVWKVTLHHDDAATALAWSRATGRIAVGWGRIGDLSELELKDADAIGQIIRKAYPRLSNSHIGGPSLWRFVTQVQQGDLVILSSRGKRHAVVEVAGDYAWVEKEDALEDYQHQRDVEATEIDPDDLWEDLGGAGDGEAVRWVVCRCGPDHPRPPRSKFEPHLTEGARVEVRSTKAERSTKARLACIDHYGYACAVCEVRLAQRYRLLEDMIHVHHLSALADSTGKRKVDPIRDLRPVCPNCHAILHTQRPPMTVDDLRTRLRSRPS